MAYADGFPNMNALDGFNKLYYWLHAYSPQAAAVVGGSATPGLTLKEIIKLSSDPEATRAAFSFDNISFALGSPQGDEKLRKVIVDTYESNTVTPEDIIVANSTTGSNHIVHRSLLKPGDHIICQYPIYGPCIEEPLDIGCDISYLRLDPDDNWSLSLQHLKSLIRPGTTKLIMLNNPANPTGTHFTTQMQREIITLAKEHNVIVHSDEIFRPLFYTDGHPPKSFIEHPDLLYDNIIVTSSLSKAYGLSGIRIGWIGTRSPGLQKQFLSYRVMSCHSVSKMDEAVATEVLNSRCRTAIMQKHIAMARTNIDLIDEFIAKYKHQCEWARPTSGAVGFVKFKDPKTGEPVDDVAFCQSLYERKRVVLSPASMCFEFGDLKNSLKGRSRIHFTTTTDNLRKALVLLGEFLDEEARDGVVNGAA